MAMQRLWLCLSLCSSSRVLSGVVPRGVYCTVIVLPGAALLQGQGRGEEALALSRQAASMVRLND